MSTLPKKSSPEDPCGHRLYEKQYKDAEALFEEGRMDETVRKAKHNLTDPTIPPYYHMKNCILIASAMTDWNDADHYVLSAKQQYAKSLALAQELENQHDLGVLEGIRKELQQLDQFRKEDIADAGIIEDSDFFPTEEDYEEFERTMREAYGIPDDDDEYHEHGDQLKDPVELARVENQDQMDAEHLRLPIRSKNEAINPTINAVPTPKDPVTTSIAQKSTSK